MTPQLLTQFEKLTSEAERIRIVAYLSFDTVYSDNFCVRCSHCPSNCGCTAPVYMENWEPNEELKALKVALFQEAHTASTLQLKEVIEHLERRCDYGPPCGRCTYCAIRLWIQANK